MHVCVFKYKDDRNACLDVRENRNKISIKKGSPEAKKESRKPRWGDFQKTNPPIFFGSDDPLDANDWLRDVE